MKILHYSLGFPPYRTGGLTKFCMDIMCEQINLGHEVALLWPGQIRFISDNVVIKRRKNVDGIYSFEIINPLPIPYDEGIMDVEAFMQSCSMKVYDDFLGEIKPDIIHVHTLMGLHKEFFEAAKKHAIKLVFTTHDYYPICPKVTLFRNGCICDCALDRTKCPECNATALSKTKRMLLQHPMYRHIKNSWIVKKIRKKHRDGFLSNEFISTKKQMYSEESINKYKKLSDFYFSIMSLFDVIHANSSVVYEEYKKLFNAIDYKIIPISHADIADKKRKKYFDDHVLRITYLGPASRLKGYYLIKEALDALWLQKKNFVLNVYFEPSEISPYMQMHERYQYSDLEKIFDETDIMLAPSVGNETFGYTVLEALSYGVPVIVSDHVGAKDIIANGCGIIIDDINSQKLKEVIAGITVKQLSLMNQNIIDKICINDVKKMTHEIMNQCY